MDFTEKSSDERISMRPMRPLPKKLFHYSKKHIKGLQPRRYLYDPYRELLKPEGLWISVEDFDEDRNWFDFWFNATQDDPAINSKLKYKHQITLHPEAKILYISNATEFDNFEERFMRVDVGISIGVEENGRKKLQIHQKPYGYYTIDWFKVVRNFPGIIIAPYLWERRNSNGFNWDSCWYYGWDCASGCIWDLRCIESFEMVQEMEIPRKKRISKK
jgi:hypothetical protein